MTKNTFLVIIGILIIVSAIILRIKARIEDQNSFSKIEKNTISSVPVIEDFKDQEDEILENFLLEGEVAISEPEEQKIGALFDNPISGQIITSPLLVEGSVSGSWFFEAVLPIKLVDDSENLIAQGSAFSKGDWMTEDLVGFSGVLEFDRDKIEADGGYVVIMKNNPSGLDVNKEAARLPVRFK